MHIPPPPPPPPPPPLPPPLPPPPLQLQLQQQCGMSSSASPDSRRLPPIPSRNSPSPASSATHSAVRAPLKSESAVEASQKLGSPYRNSAKRPRYEYEQSHSSRVSPNSEASLTGAILSQAVSSPVLGDANKGPSAVPTGAASSPDPEHGPGKCPREPVPAEGNNIGGGPPQECEDCKHVRQNLGASTEGLTKSLDLIITSLKSGEIARKSIAASTPQAHHLSAAHGIVGPESPQVETARRRLGVEMERDDPSNRGQHSSMDESTRAPESAPLPSLRERRRRSFAGDVTTAQPQSAVSQSPSSGYFPSPMQATPTNMRALSSAPSLGFSGNPILPPISPSQPSQAALTAHLSDLQHQVGTKSLALQTLQSDHNRLQSAFQRSQMRCATLEKKFQVSDAEINALTEERNRLQTQCEAYEKQVEDLLEQRNAANKMSIAGGGQYTSIIQQANLLESQTLTTRKKWKAEREEWERQKEEMEQRIKLLETSREERLAGGKQPHVPDGSSDPTLKTGSPSDLSVSTSTGSPTNVSKLTVVSGDITLSSNPDDLRQEITRLRHRINDLNRTVQDLKSEGQSIDQLVCDLVAAGKRMVAKADVTLEGASATADL